MGYSCTAVANNKVDYYNYLYELYDSGHKNMLNADIELREKFPELSVYEAQRIVLYWYKAVMTRKYKIKVKRDFGNTPYLINGRYVKTGFVVTNGFCNVMPGAVWFRDIPGAMEGIRILEKSKATGINFWKLWKQEKDDFRAI